MRVLLPAVVPLMFCFQASAEDEDWGALLGVGDESESSTGVIGMTAEELDAYAKEESAVGSEDDEVPDVFVRNRRRFVLREVKFNSDWDCDPTAVPALVHQFKRLTGMDSQALVPRSPLTLESDSLTDWPFIYMTAHYAFNLNDHESKGLRRFIMNGGFLYADDCLYGQTFGPAFEGEIQRVFPEFDWKTMEYSDPVYGMVYQQKYRSKAIHESGVPRVIRNANPWSGLFIGGSVSVLYTPQDFGCHWEISSPPTPTNPLGAGMHNMDLVPGARDAAYKIGINIIFYSFLH
ncbi:MAG: DUF4159 domain-containing protein [Planctomycetota bacterium]|nr:DUF4159 domain-containing protein [Planctomycetota bacterium]